QFWTITNLVVVALAAYGGFEFIQPRNHGNTNADWTFVGTSFVVTTIFPWGAMHYSRSRGVAEWKRSSLDRNPFNWWTDPLQSIRVSILEACAFVLGGSAALLHTDKQGVMLFWWS